MFPWDQVSREHNSPLIPGFPIYEEHSNYVLYYKAMKVFKSILITASSFRKKPSSNYLVILWSWCNFNHISLLPSQTSKSISFHFARPTTLALFTPTFSCKFSYGKAISTRIIYSPHDCIILETKKTKNTWKVWSIPNFLKAAIEQAWDSWGPYKRARKSLPFLGG